MQNKAFGFRVQVGGQGVAGLATGAETSAQKQAARKVTRMCLVIVTTFTVAWLPYQLDILIINQGSKAHLEGAVAFLDAAETLAYINSCVNPIVYALKWKPFRTSLVQVRDHQSAGGGLDLHTGPG